jgi:tetratricopeptide (TPR) repeat protein
LAGMQKFDILMEQEEYDKAYDVARKLIEGPYAEDADMLNAIAWAIVDPEADVRRRDPRLAIEAAEKAARLTDGKNAAILDTLARCWWCEGEKAKAIETATKALELACKDDEMPDAMKDGIKASLDEYKKGAIQEKKEGESRTDRGTKGKGGEQDA